MMRLDITRDFIDLGKVLECYFGFDRLSELLSKEAETSAVYHTLIELCPILGTCTLLDLQVLFVKYWKGGTAKTITRTLQRSDGSTYQSTYQKFVFNPDSDCADMLGTTIGGFRKRLHRVRYKVKREWERSGRPSFRGHFFSRIPRPL